MYGIIGGTGFEEGIFDEKFTVDTDYGDVTVFKSGDIYFISRHGTGHENPPHLINYRANISALEKMGVKFLFSTSAVGSMNEDFHPGELVLLKDFLDFTNGRKNTFFEDETAHVMMNEPYCPNLNDILEAEFKNLPYKGRAVYVATEGPRFETATEIKFYKMIGADVVGMTNVPEVNLAKEAGMCYASVGIVTNWATGFGALTNFHEIDESIKKTKKELFNIFLSIFNRGIKYENCTCREALIRL